MISSGSKSIWVPYVADRGQEIVVKELFNASIAALG
jgi:hypothetical protein